MPKGAFTPCGPCKRAGCLRIGSLWCWCWWYVWYKQCTHRVDAIWTANIFMFFLIQIFFFHRWTDLFSLFVLFYQADLLSVRDEEKTPCDPHYSLCWAFDSGFLHVHIALSFISMPMQCSHTSAHWYFSTHLNWVSSMNGQTDNPHALAHCQSAGFLLSMCTPWFCHFFPY